MAVVLLVYRPKLIRMPVPYFILNRNAFRYFFSAFLFLFPVLISGFPFLRRDGNDTDTSSSNSTSAPINGEPVNSTSSTAPTGSSNTTDSSSNSTSSTAPLVVVIQPILRTANDLNCTFDLSSVIDESSTVNLIDSLIYVESIKVMGTEQDILNNIYENAHQFSRLAANITLPTVPLGSHPNLTQEDYNSLLFKFSPSCLTDLGLQNLPHHAQESLGSPHAFASPPFIIGAGTRGCSDLSAVFCQAISADLNATAVVSPQPGSCLMQTSPGVLLFYTTRTSEPLPIDLAERQAQDGNICTGPDLLFVA
ncbi:hypothetical protein Clacol_001925 [Clathrus columnatus]|uniref:Uncharacterized protein n=1 Tax=Clathrus columnatus TaxID=1419009 RepID=A0AAV5A730_9AGAM|nr:hypothetical protein Clacol_001925 [Clathrus columnatus]